MSEIMTPLEFSKKYTKLWQYLYPLEGSVNGAPKPGGNTLKEGPTTLRVATYRLGHSDWPGKFWPEISTFFKKPVTVKVTTISGLPQEIPLTGAKAGGYFPYPFVGKGSPEQVQMAIQLIYRFHRASIAPQEFVAANFVGLDCNGFVGNYIQRVVKGIDWLAQNNDEDPGPTTYMSALLEWPGSTEQVTDLDDMSEENTYLFGYCRDDGSIIDPSKGHYGHIMITSPGPGELTHTANGIRVRVVESAGRVGVVSRYYNSAKVIHAAHGMVVYFDIEGGGHIPVRIARLKFDKDGWKAHHPTARRKAAPHKPGPNGAKPGTPTS